MLFPDLVFESQAQEIAFEDIERSDHRCSHCHRRIFGKVYQQGTKYFDSYCWQFRFINRETSDERAKGTEMRHPSEPREST